MNTEDGINPSLSLRERQKLETRQHILSVAKSLFMEHGYENTTMRALALAAGVGLGTISLHFKDKKSLLLASFHREIGQVAFAAFESVPKGESIRDQVIHILTSVYGFYKSNTGYLRIVVKEALFVRGEWREIFDAQIAEFMGLIVDMLEEAKARGELKPDVDCQSLSMVLWSIYINGIIEGFKQEVFDPELQAARVTPLWDVVLDGILEESA